MFLLKKDSEYFTSRPNINRYYEERIKSRPSYHAVFSVSDSTFGSATTVLPAVGQILISNLTWNYILRIYKTLSIFLRWPEVWSWSTLEAGTLNSASFVPSLFLYNSCTWSGSQQHLSKRITTHRTELNWNLENQCLSSSELVPPTYLLLRFV